MSVTEVAKILGITSSTVTQLVNELVKKENVVRKEGDPDRRLLSLKLSEKSKKQISKMRTENIKWLMSMFECLSDKELAEYAKLYKKISDGMGN